jgi:4-hydroxybenzoate polyprenyltransferase
MTNDGVQMVEAAEHAPRNTVVGTVSGLARACHPAPSVVVTALVTALAAASGRDARGCVLVALAVLTGQLSVGWSNDLVDRARDVAADRRDKPLVTGDARPRAVLVATGCALVLCVPLSLASGLLAGAAHLLGVAGGWGYNLGLKRTVASPLPYALGFGLLPAFVALGLPGHPWPPSWAVAAAVLLGLGAHIANVLPDIDADLAAGIRGLPQRMGRRAASVVAVLALVGASTVLVFGPAGRVGPAGWAGLAVTVVLAPAALWLPRAGAGSGAEDRTAFLATLGVAAVDVVLLLLRGSTLA